MTLPSTLTTGLTLPVIAAPLFIISNPQTAIAQCTAGVIGAFPALNARPAEALDEWFNQITGARAAWNAAHPARPAAPYAVNLIVHRSNERLTHDLELCVKHRAPLVITSLGARPEVNDAVHAYGGFVLHDVISNEFAHKAIDKGADGLVAVAAGAGGHAGTISPFALVQEIREWFSGPLALSGAIATGGAILAAQACGADLAYIGSAFIATTEANAEPEYKQAIVDATAADIVYSNLFTGIHGNYLRASIAAAGLDPDHLPSGAAADMNFHKGATKAWKNIWGAGQGIGAVHAVTPTAILVARLRQEYEDARARLEKPPAAGA